MKRNILLYIFSLLVLSSFFSCVGMIPTKEVRYIDSLNSLAYDYRYKHLDTSFHFALAAHNQSSLYKQGKAEANNNMAFCAFMKMDFELAERLYRKVYSLTQNELECLIADIGLMKIYQRVAMNKEYYDHRNSALRRMKRIREDSNVFNERHEIVRLNFAFTEFYIVSAIYYYYLQQRGEAMASLDEIQINNAFRRDTNQYLYFHYIKGAAGLCDGITTEQHKLCEFDELYSTWLLASQGDYLYFVANCLQGIADLMASPKDYNLFTSRRLHDLLHLDIAIDSLLPLRIGQRALEAFKSYDDMYQIAGTYVSIGKYLNSHGRYEEALDTLHKALNYVNQHHSLYYHHPSDSMDILSAYLPNDTMYTEMVWIEHEKIKTVPEWISRIREQLSVSYAGLGMKIESDYNRNIYLDILNDTRQDKELESRYIYLAAESNQLSLILAIAIVGMLLVGLLFWVFNKRSVARNKLYIEKLQNTLSLCKDITASIPINIPLIQDGLNRLFGKERVIIEVSDENIAELRPKEHLKRDETALLHVLMPYIEWVNDNEQLNASLSDERNQFEKQRYIYEQHIAANKRENVIKKACLAIVNGITPYIDRILNEVNKLVGKGFINNSFIKKEKYQYIDELVTTINEYNDILALWIKMKQGSLSLNIETFPLDDLFGLIAKGKRTFEQKKQVLDIESTGLWVKADKALTLFMINTLADNARKYTSDGGRISIYARRSDDYVEISVKDSGRGLSEEDVARITGEKIYNSHDIGINNDVEIDESLLLNKGSGFGLMNCKGIIEKYRKTNTLFQVCQFGVESKLNVGSRFYFRLPIGIKKTFTILFFIISSILFAGCNSNSIYSADLAADSLDFTIDSDYDVLLNKASEFANAAYFANVDHNYSIALQYADSVIELLNRHYATYSSSSGRSMQLVEDAMPAELTWWNDGFDTDYHTILDIRNEAAVAFLALKQIEGYNYNNEAYTALYKLQSEDQSLETYCRQLERSAINKTIGIILCILLLVILFIGYYVISFRKRMRNQLHLEQVFEINKKIFTSSLLMKKLYKGEALQREEDTLKEVPQHLVQQSFDAINDLLGIDFLGLAVYSATSQQLLFASEPHIDVMPPIMKECFKKQVNQIADNAIAIPLIIDIGDTHQGVGVLYMERSETIRGEVSLLLAEFIASYVAIVVYNAIVKLAVKYRDIEDAHEEAQRASWEDGLLHVQNMVLDNCLSTIKHETIYYPNKIKQIINRLTNVELPIEEERENVIAICELIEYYKGIFTILSSCASRQLEEVTFRRTTIAVKEICEYARKYFQRITRKSTLHIELQIEVVDKKISGDLNQVKFLVENLLNEALTFQTDGILRLVAEEDEEYIRFLFTDTRREKSITELNQLFYPSLNRMMANENGDLSGTEYLICKQIIRDHDEFAGRRGCRINAEPSDDGGFTVYFTLPKK